MPTALALAQEVESNHERYTFASSFARSQEGAQEVEPNHERYTFASSFARSQVGAGKIRHFTN